MFDSVFFKFFLNVSLELDNEIGDVAVKYIANMLKVNKKLTSINLNCESIVFCFCGCVNEFFFV